MPLYTYRDKNTGEVFEVMMSYRDIEAYNDAHPDHEKLIDAPNIVSGVSLTGKLDGGFKDVLSKISDAHPDSPLASQHRSKSIKEVQTERVVRKWRSTQASG
jgi:hypothetical protein